ncbi:MAG: peptide chain release factor 2, partial [Spirochaetales bacterium]|nr:peptide chain release factor 2 [Spirochaetales bacterium]
KAEKALTRLKRLKQKIEPWQSLIASIQELRDLYDLAKKENDPSLEEDIRKSLEAIRIEFEHLRIMELLSDELDIAPSFLTIHSGAGGTEACDWANMLLRMYTRWAERKNYKVEVLDLLEAEGGIKSVTLQVTGDYAYGYLKGETGIHRLVRISPFDANARRHTSFASVYASPVIEDDIEVDIRPEDLRIDTYRSSGAGGQHVNKTDSAVRITHYPTGIVVQCQNERSQIKNRAIAMKILKSRLYEYYKEEQDKKNAEKALEKKDISWGNQIRSYVFHPYNLVKDHRTKYEVGNIQAVMDGYIDDFIEAYLRHSWQEANKVA